MTYRTEIALAASAHGLDPDLVAAVVEQESSGRFYAYRYEPAFWARYLQQHPDYRHRIPEEVSASYGLMQTMFSTAREHGYDGEPWGLFDPRVSLDIGCRVLAKLMTWAAQNEAQALGAYNAGRGNWNSTAGLAYAASVLKRAVRLRAGR